MTLKIFQVFKKQTYTLFNYCDQIFLYFLRNTLKQNTKLFRTVSSHTSHDRRHYFSEICRVQYRLDSVTLHNTTSIKLIIVTLPTSFCLPNWQCNTISLSKTLNSGIWFEEKNIFKTMTRFFFSKIFWEADNYSCLIKVKFKTRCIMQILLHSFTYTQKTRNYEKSKRFDQLQFCSS